MISKKAKYALKALKVLAERHGQADSSTVSEIAILENIPRKFLEAILLELRNNGLLTSHKGKNGGYSLKVDPDKITLARVLRIIDGPIAPTLCVSIYYYDKCEDCPDEETCPIRPVMLKVRDANLHVYEKTTLLDFIQNKKTD